MRTSFVYFSFLLLGWQMHSCKDRKESWAICHSNIFPSGLHNELWKLRLINHFHNSFYGGFFFKGPQTGCLDGLFPGTIRAHMQTPVLLGCGRESHWLSVHVRHQAGCFGYVLPSSPSDVPTSWEVGFPPLYRWPCGDATGWGPSGVGTGLWCEPKICRTSTCTFWVLVSMTTPLLKMHSMSFPDRCLQVLSPGYTHTRCSLNRQILIFGIWLCLYEWESNNSSYCARHSKHRFHQLRGLSRAFILQSFPGSPPQEVVRNS